VNKLLEDKTWLALTITKPRLLFRDNTKSRIHGRENVMRLRFKVQMFCFGATLIIPTPGGLNRQTEIEARLGS
jgi:hypothetical protein